MRVLHVTSEIAPYAKTGGLGDVLGALPIVLSHRIMIARAQNARQRSFEQAERIIQDLLESIPVPV